MDPPPPPRRKRKRGYQKIGRGEKGNKAKSHRPGALTSLSRPRRMTNVVDNAGQAGVAAQPSSSGGRSSGRGLSASASRSSEGEVRLLKRKLSYSVRKAVRKSDKVKCLKEVNLKLKVDIEEEVRRGKRVE